MKDNAKDNDRRNLREEISDLEIFARNQEIFARNQEQLSKKMPWIDRRLSEGEMTSLWDTINRLDSVDQTSSKFPPLAGNISRSTYMEDNWLYKNVLKEMSEYVYYKEWSNYHNVYVARIEPPPKFTLDKLWVNFQKQHEFNPPHYHVGLYSFVIFMKIPTHWKEQHALPISVNSNSPQASDFQFIIGLPEGRIQTCEIALSPEDEGRLLFFPAWLHHQVFPFYGTEEERITVSGNIFIDIE